MTLSKCPVCLVLLSKPEMVTKTLDGFCVDCINCGRFALSEEAWEDFLDPQSGAGHKLSELCRARLAHRIRTGSSTDSSDRPKLTSEFVERFIKDGCPGPTPAEQADRIIKYIGDELARSGKRVEALPEHLFALVGAPNPAFVGDIAIELHKRGLIDGVIDGPAPTLLNVSLTLDGWERYESERRGQIAGKYGFIAMKFGDARLDPFVTTVVKPTVERGIGYELLDMRDLARAGIIDNIMRAQIRDARFVIVDLTHDNAGAYWEAGYAEGLGKPVIYICERSKFDEAKTHFDTNHCTTVLWSCDDGEGFSRELVATLRRSLNLFPGAA